jgi:NAD(P)H-dependent FMN reductase
MRILAISGSLRARSTNTELLRAAASLAPAGVRVTLYDGLAALPHFNPDVEARGLPPRVVEWRSCVAATDALLISSPEYAHGVPGALKNALDWLVSGVQFVGKPVALFNASLLATHALASLAETVRTMAGHLVTAASGTLPVSGRSLDAAAIVADRELAAAVRAALAALAEAITHGRAEAISGRT